MSVMRTLLSVILLYLPALLAHATADLPPHIQVDRALDEHVSVLNARSQLQIEHSEQRKRESGDYEFTVHGALYRDRLLENGDDVDYRDWEVAIERPFRLPNKMWIDSEIGEAGVERGRNKLGDARHETSRLLLQLWFDWQREQAQAAQWQQQVEILRQQATITEKRIRAGDAPRMELNQINAAAAMSGVSLRQAQLRTELAADQLQRQFKAIKLPAAITPVEPQSIEQPLSFWRGAVLEHNHELGLAKSEAVFQNRLAARASADRLPDPTLGLRYASQLNNRQKIGGIYFSIPLGYSARSASADSASHTAVIAADREQALRIRLEGDIFSAYTRAVSTFQIWQQARDASSALHQNAELVARAYSLGESSLDATLIARRQSLEAALAENTARLDANEARYRLQLDAHQLWTGDNDRHQEH
ncbi:MAG: transporter [Gallionellaceae bacterium CG1_02_60_948]|nr:MAG: transporter [Gallionellaceae bacterium CG1_02_60_948]